MTKLNLKLLIAILAVALVAGAGIFYACNKEPEKNLKKEAEFVAKINKETCVQVTIYRDAKNNAHFVTKKTANDSNIPIGIILPDELNIKPQNTKNGEGVIIEIPDDAIYWFVPLDGNEPEKVPPGHQTVTCTCTLGKPNCFENLNCKAKEVKDKYGTYILCITEGCCKSCGYLNSISCSTSTSYSLRMGSSYIVQSNTVTVNGITYE